MFLIGWAIGLLIGSLFSDTAAAVGFATVFFAPFLVYGGHIQEIKKISIYFRWFWFLSPFRFSFEPLFLKEQNLFRTLLMSTKSLIPNGLKAIS
jgi:ABC-type multidrug transport system permease subunit